MKKIIIAVAVASALSSMGLAQAQGTDSWYVVTSKPSMSKDYTSQDVGKENLRFDLNSLSQTGNVFVVQDNQHFNVSGFDTVEVVNATANVGVGGAVIWSNRTATASFTDVKNVYFGSQTEGLKTTDASAVLMSYGKVDFGEEKKRLENFGLYATESGVTGLLANSCITSDPKAPQNTEQTSQISVYADNITVATQGIGIYSMIAPMADNSTGNNDAGISLHGTNVSITSANSYAVTTSAMPRAKNPKGGQSGITIRADEDITIQGVEGIVASTGIKNQSVIDIEAGGNVIVNATYGIQGGVMSGYAAEGSYTTISGKNVSITGGYEGINLMNGSIKTTVAADETITVGGTANSVIGRDGADLTLKSRTPDKTVTLINQQCAFEIEQGSLTLGNVAMDMKGYSLKVDELKKLDGYGDSTIYVTRDTEGAISIGSVEKGWINLVDKNGTLTEKYGSPEAVMKRMREAILKGEIVDNYETVSAQASDMTGGWTYDPTTGTTAWEFGESDSPTLAAAKHFNAATLSQWRYENNHLSDRLGDIRYAKDRVGSWARVYGMDAKVSDSVSTKFNAKSIQVGLDFPVADNWLVGAAFGYTDADAEFTNGSADSDGYTLAVYGTATLDCGAYVDVIGRIGRMSSDVNVSTVTAFNASYDNTTFGLSAEVGYRWDLSDTFYVIPQAELSYGYVKGDSYTASNDIHVDQDDFTTLVGRAGVQLGANFAEKRGQIYLTASVNHEFKGDTEATATRAGATDQNLMESLDGTWVSYGLGAQFTVIDSLSFYGSLTRANGSDYQENYRYSVGARYVW